MPDIDYRKAIQMLLLIAGAYIVFVLITTWSDFGLTDKPDASLKWMTVRIATVSGWLLLAAILLRIRQHSLHWDGAVTAFAVTVLATFMIASSIVPEGANFVVVAASFFFFAAISGLYGLTAGNRILASVIGVVIFVAQLAVDALAHVFSGLFKLH